MSQRIDVIDIEASLRVAYPNFNWSVRESYAHDWLEITCNMPSRGITQVIDVRHLVRGNFSSIAENGRMLVTALQQEVGLNAEVRVAESILRRYFSGVSVAQNADGSMEILIDDRIVGIRRSYHINSVESIGTLIAELLVTLVRGVERVPSVLPATRSQEHHCVTGVMLERKVTL